MAETNMQLSAKLAAYVMALEHCAANTHRAEDRPIYASYLADAAGLLAHSVAGSPLSTIQSRISAHNRLWGYTWLQDPVFKPAADRFSEVEEELKRAAI